MNGDLLIGQNQKRLRRIVDVLLVNSSFIDDVGISYGKMGIAIFFYRLYRLTDEKKYEEYADFLIDQVYENVHSDQAIDFETGLTGIGWGIEYLCKNSFLDANTDDVLVDIDQIIHQRLCSNISLAEFRSVLLYMHSRYTLTSNESLSGSRYVKQKVFEILLKDCETILGRSDLRGQKVIVDSDTLKIMSLFFTRLNGSGSFSKKAEELLSMLSEMPEPLVGQAHPTSDIELATSQIWNELLFGVEVDIIDNNLFDFIDNSEDWESILNNLENRLGLFAGLAGIGMALCKSIFLINARYEFNPSIFDLDEGSVKSNDKANNDIVSVFIFRSEVRGMQYGIGTYINELSAAISLHKQIDLFVINCHNYKTKEILLTRHSFGNQIDIPSPSFYKWNDNNSKKYATIVVHILQRFISCQMKVVFHVNFVDALPIVRTLKNKFKHPVVSVVHSASWQSYLNGNETKLFGYKNSNRHADENEKMFSLEREFYELSDRIISVTEYMKDFLVSWYGIDSKKISIIPNGLEYKKYVAFPEKKKQEIKRIFGFAPDDKIILFSGRVDSCKGIDFLIPAFIQACNHTSNLRLVILGDGNLQEVKKKITCYYGSITFTGYVPQLTVNQFYQIADIGVAPSIYDHCPYTVLEMMSNKIPLIVSDIDGLNEILTSKEALIVRSVPDTQGEIGFKINEMADAILLLLNNEDLQDKLKAAAYASIKKRHGSEQMAIDTIAMYNLAIG